MTKEELVKRFEELNAAIVYRKSSDLEYRQILYDLEQLGALPLSHTLINDDDRQSLIAALPELQ